MMDLQGKTAIVTGGSRGIGRAVCLELASRGARVAVNFRSDHDAAQEVTRGIGTNALAIQADVSDRAAVKAMVARTEAELGAPDILVNNAGLLYPGSLLDYDEEQFDRMWRTNVKGVLYCCEAVAPGMIERGWGRIVNLSSNAAIGTALPGTTLYAATKGAVLTLTKRLAFELSPSGITVNAVLPGFTKTDMVLAGKTEEEAARLIEAVSNRSLVGRVGEPADIASLVGYACSEASAFMTGQFLLADGGRQDYLTRV